MSTDLGKEAANEIGFFIFGIFTKVPDHSMIVLHNRQKGFFEMKVKRFFSELQKHGIDDAFCQNFVETCAINPQELTDLSTIIFHAIDSSDDVRKAIAIAYIFIDFTRKQLSIDTAVRLVRAVQIMYYPDIIKLISQPIEDCLDDQIFIDSSLSSGILTALEKGRFTDGMEDAPLAYRLNYLGKELITVMKNVHS